MHLVSHRQMINTAITVLHSIQHISRLAYTAVEMLESASITWYVRCSAVN